MLKGTTSTAMGAVARTAAVCVMGVLALPAMANGVAKASAGANSNTANFPGIATASDSGGFASYDWNASARASPLGLHAQAYMYYGTDRYYASASFTSAEDTTFYYSSNYNGGQSDWVEFSLGGGLTGTVTGTDWGGAGSWDLLLGLSGPLYLEPDFSKPASSSDTSTRISGRAVVSPTDGMTYTVNETASTQRLWVPRGEAIGVSAALTVAAQGRFANFQYGGADVDFSDSFHFNPNGMFTIYTEGVTVDAPSMGLYGNVLSAVPEPETYAMMLAGLGLVGAVARRRQRRG